MASHVDFLAADELKGRAPGTDGDRQARAYILTAFHGIGLEPLFSNGFEQPFIAELDSGRASTANIGGIVRGTAHADEYVLFVAHHDHIGMCEADRKGDAICNGAVDNASGVAALVELGRVFAADPPERSVILLATGAEEAGLLGARHFVAHSPVPLERIAAAFSLDSVAARGYTRDTVIVGSGRTTLDDLIARAAARQGRRVVKSRSAQNFFELSDHFAFAEAGVPALVVTGLFAPGQQNFLRGVYRRDRYHQPGDNPGAGIDYSGAAADAALLFAIAHEIGRLDMLPRLREPGE